MMWPRLEHPDGGIIGALHAMENLDINKTQDEGDSSEDEALSNCMFICVHKKTKKSDEVF